MKRPHVVLVGGVGDVICSGLEPFAEVLAGAGAGSSSSSRRLLCRAMRVVSVGCAFRRRWTS